MLGDSSHAHLTKFFGTPWNYGARNQRFASMRMTSTAVNFAARRDVVMGDGFTVPSGEEILSNDISDAVSRAASLRSESDMLRRRASVVREDAIRDQYLALADRFSMLAASLEVRAIAELMR